MPRIPRYLQRSYDKNRNGIIDSDSVSVEGVEGPQGPQGDTGPQGPPGEDGTDGVSIVGATSDGVNITFELSNGETIDVPWPAQS